MEGRSQIPIEDPIFIDLALRTSPGMKAFFNFHRTLNDNIGGEKAIEGPLNGLGIQRTLRFKVGHLSQGMNTRIRSSRTHEMDLLTCERG
jgi:hypothetical protein